VRVLFVKQDHASPSGFVGSAFTDLGYDVSEFTVVPASRYDSPDVTAVFPDPGGHDAIVFFGAAWSVYDEDTIGSWIGEEIAFARSAMDLGVPVLGICFGAQMLAAAIGGSVSRAPAPEIGWSMVDTSIPGLIDAGPWFQWHFDRFTAPSGVPVLARTAAADQAFQVGRTLGLQFHPELTTPVLECWLDNGGTGQLAAAGVDASALVARTRSLEGGAAVRAYELVRRFVTDVTTAPLAPLPAGLGAAVR
jgi:GMP synthase-like glutamine amidotransferase